MIAGFPRRLSCRIQTLSVIRESCYCQVMLTLCSNAKMVLIQGVSWLWLYCIFTRAVRKLWALWSAWSLPPQFYLQIRTISCSSCNFLVSCDNSLIIIFFFLTDEEDPLMWFEVGVCDRGQMSGPCGTAHMPLREEWHLAHSSLELLWAELDPVRKLPLSQPIYLVSCCKLATQCADCFCMGSKLSRRTVLEC